MSKKVSYQNLLKQAIAEFDTSKTVDVKGPMLDPILQWDGDGELPIYKDAASILERYYFNENADDGVEVAEMEYNEDGKEGKTASEKDAEGTGTSQAGTSDKATIAASKKDIESDLALEAEFDGKDVPKGKEYTEEQEEAEEEEAEEEVEEGLENQIIEKLIAEMEEEEEEEEEEEMSEMDMTYTGEGPKEEAPKEKKASGPEQDAQGAGTQQAGTGDAEGQVPNRKDVADTFVKPKNYTEQDEMEDKGEEKEEGGEEEEKDLDVDKEMKEQAAGHVPPPSMQKKMKGEDQGDEYEEAFQIFKEAIEDEEEEGEEEEE